MSARSPDRSARCFLDTPDACPPNRSVSAPWQVSAAFVQLEPHRSAGRSARSARTAPDRHAAAVPFSVATQPLATRLGNSGWLMLACSLCPGPLGPATVTDDRHRQARTRVRWTARSRSCCVVFGGFPPLSLLHPAEPRLLDFHASATSRVIRLFRHWGYQSGSERVSPLHLSRFVVLPVRQSPVPTA